MHAKTTDIFHKMMIEAMAIPVFIILSKVFVIMFSFSHFNCYFIDNTLNITFDGENSTYILNSSYVSNSAKCLIICEMIKCKSIRYKINNCSLYFGDPSLIRHTTLGNLTLNYYLGIYFCI